jgi:hypothetical protein
VPRDDCSSAARDPTGDYRHRIPLRQACLVLPERWQPVPARGGGRRYPRLLLWPQKPMKLYRPRGDPLRNLVVLGLAVVVGVLLVPNCDERTLQAKVDACWNRRSLIGPSPAMPQSREQLLSWVRASREGRATEPVVNSLRYLAAVTDDCRF